MHFKLLASQFLFASALGFQWFWEDDETTTLQSAIATSSGASVYSTVPSSYYADGEAYVPKSTACPTGKVVRKATKISADEEKYISGRQEITNKNLETFLAKVANLKGFDAEEFLANAERNISIGLAFSGGGYRAMLCGAGSMLALDSRFDESTDSGLGGLLQSSSYITGLSGGSWLVGTLAVNNWISVADILDEESGIWDLEDSVFNPSGINLIKTIAYYNNLREAVDAKEDAGFETTLTDVWGRALSYQFFNESFYKAGENVTWSDLRQLDSFKSHQMPYPIFVADARNPGAKIINLNSTVFEMSPYELGSWDTALNGFVDSRYLGTDLDNGEPNGSFCVTNYDNAGFLMGTSSSIFNQILVKTENSSSMNWVLKKLLEMIFGSFSESNTDIAAYEPNPFYNWKAADSETITSSDSLNLVDGGEDNQNIPYYPLIQKTRNVDVIFSFDNSADTSTNWPNGSAITYTYKRQFTVQGYGTPFPFVPSYETFIEDGLNQRPVFFGCNASDLDVLVEFHGSSQNSTDIPLVVYIPNAEYSYESNTSTYKMTYDHEEKWSIITNAYELASMNNRTDDENWNKCVGCAIIRREQERRGEEQTEECKECFRDYCWVGGVEDSAEPAASELLALVTASVSEATGASATTSALKSFQSATSKTSTKGQTKATTTSSKTSSKATTTSSKTSSNTSSRSSSKSTSDS